MLRRKTSGKGERLMRILPRIFLNDPLFRLLTVNCGIGTVVAAMIVTLLLVADVHGIGSLVLNTQSPVVAVALLFGGFFITFTSADMGWAIMRLGTVEREAGGGGHAARAGLVPLPVTVPVQARRQR
ncbi:hypothetical protein ACKTEK_04155 [Tepidamorphus sp. 3E244]|uniref:hypothetical protein n=1 Tax=Tepidamorphus sp. 3E244 TaxID=3385498 RepID=UPI0038FCA57D